MPNQPTVVAETSSVPAIRDSRPEPETAPLAPVIGMLVGLTSSMLIWVVVGGLVWLLLGT